MAEDALQNLQTTNHKILLFQKHNQLLNLNTLFFLKYCDRVTG